MKLITLDRRHHLFREGWKFAYRFEGYGSNSDAIQKVERLLREQVGSQWERYPQWTVYWSKTVHKTYGRLYWIGIRDQEVAMLLTLAGLNQDD